jgi:phenylacetate-CoA ligase
MSPSYLDRCLWEELLREAPNDASLREAIGSGLTRALIDRLQYVRLRRTLAYVAQKSSFYRQLYSELSFDPYSVGSLDDIRRIPFTEPRHIISEPFRLACVSIGDVTRIVTIASSGTSGEAKKVLFTEADLRRIATLFAADTRQVVGEKRVVVQIMLPGTALFGQANILGKAMEAAGSVAVITGDDVDMKAQIESISRNHCTALVGYSSYLYKLTRLGGLSADLGRMGIDWIVTAGEPLPQSVKKVLEDVWKAKVFSHYGLTEMGFNTGMECGQGTGYHIHEADFIVEIVDPETGTPVEEGAEGELVLTSINRQAMPLVRYRTRDVTRILAEQSRCGSVLRRIGPVRRLGETTIRLGGGKIETSDLDEILFSIPDIIDYRISEGDDPNDETLRFLIETAPPGTNLNPGLVRDAVEERLYANGIISRPEKTVEVRLVPSFAPAHKRSVRCEPSI